MAAIPSRPEGDTSPHAGEGAQHFGPFRILERIGEGGMGVVYLAERRTPVEQRVALKVIRTDRLDKTYRARFAMEQQALARMDHPNIARLLDAGSEGEQSWFAMEYVPGQPLSDYCTAHRLSVQRRLQLFVQVCDGVQHAHIKGILHRDLKPANILVREIDGRAVAKIIDFGLAQPVDPLQIRATLHESVKELVGTIAYMSPEQAVRTEGDLDTRTDVYSLGVVLYELLTGELPLDPGELKKSGFDWFGAMLRDYQPLTPSLRLSSLGDRLQAAAHERSTSPKRLRSLERGDLDWVTMKAIARDRQHRYPTVRELGRDIERFLRHRPVEAGPPSAWYVTVKWLRRHVRSVSIAAFVLVTGLTVAIVAAAMSARAREAEARRELMAKGALAGDYVRRAREDLWPANEARVGAMQAWLAATEEFDGLGEELAAFDAELRSQVVARNDREAALLASQQDLVAAGLRHVEELAGERTLIERRLERASTLIARTIDAYASRWAAARAELATDERFAAFVLPDLPGLVPLGKNPQSGLQEFYLLDSADPEGGLGELPHLDDQGCYAVGPRTGLIFVLVPGGTFQYALDADGKPIAPRQLQPFLVSRYETTQAQWVRLAEERTDLGARIAANPSQPFPIVESKAGERGADADEVDPAVLGWGSPAWVHPVQSVSWLQATAVLRRHGLDLPTIAQWIWATHGGPAARLRFEWGEKERGRFINCRDSYAEAVWADKAPPSGEPGPLWDGFVFTAPVHTLAPNPYGLHHTFGNVEELVRDGYEPAPRLEAEGPEQTTADALSSRVAVSIGGSMVTAWAQRAEDVTHQVPVTNVDPLVGFRAVFPLPSHQR
jgi:serine/threonine protein kinase/formylglycine-generating enzyme required for sulfatase activity